MRARSILLSLTSLLGLTSLMAAVSTADATPRPSEEVIVALDRLQSRYAAALARALYDRSDPAVREVANEVTEEALAIIEEAPPLAEQARTLVRDAAGDALGPWLERHGISGDSLLGAWLRDRDDAALYQRLRPSDERGRLALAQEVVFTRPALSQELALEAINGGHGTAGMWCFVSLALPPSQRGPVVRALAAQPRALHFGDCLVLQSLDPSGRVELARRTLEELALPPSTDSNGEDEPAWPLVAAALTLPTMTAAQSARVIRALASAERRLDWPTAAFELARAMPYLNAEHPRVLPLIVAAMRRAPVVFARRVPLLPRVLLERVRHAPGASPAEQERIAAQADSLLLETAVTTPRGAGGAAVVRALLAMRSRTSGSTNDLLSRRVDEWVDAIEATERCDAGCLRALTVHGSDATAARAAWLLGSDGLASAPPEQARALVDRIVIERAVGDSVTQAPMPLSASTLSSVFFALARQCPLQWRGLALRPPAGMEPYVDPSAPWRMRLSARCRDARSPQAPR